MREERTNRDRNEMEFRFRSGIWDILVAEDDTHIDLEELAAFAERRLSPAQHENVRRLVSRSPRAMELVDSLQGFLESEAAEAAQTGLASPRTSPSRARKPVAWRVPWRSLAVTASVAVALGSLWVLRTDDSIVERGGPPELDPRFEPRTRGGDERPTAGGTCGPPGGRGWPARSLAGILAQRLTVEQNPSARRDLVLALGEYPSNAGSTEDRANLERELLTIYQDDPDSGLHSAVDWLLRRWNGGVRPPAVLAVDQKLASGAIIGDRRWYVSRTGATLAVFPAGAVFDLGTPPHVKQRPFDEVYHRQPIARSWALAVREVTVEEFNKFCAANPAHAVRPETARSAPEPDCPVTEVTWYAAAKYCRWLSDVEDIQEAEMCYPPVEEIGPRMELADDYLDRSGYRLPTEAEWEYACREGTATGRYYGEDPAMLSQYAWYAGNAAGRTHPAGLLKPNDFGLFDMLGNVWEWCDNRYVDFPGGDAGNEGHADDRSLRGGSFSCGPGDLRSTRRHRMEPQGCRDCVGLRVARTLPQPTKR